MTSKESKSRKTQSGERPAAGTARLAAAGAGGTAGATTGEQTTPATEPVPTGTDAPQPNPPIHTTSVPRTARRLTDVLADMSAFPPLGTSPASLSSAQPGSGSLQRTVEGALQAVLGKVPRPGDPQSFVAALTVAFTYREGAAGRGRYEWTPRTYTGMTDVSRGVTGAQASLVTFARTSYDNSLPLLEGLYPLVARNAQEVDALRTILRAAWTEFVHEFGREAGPRVARANELIASILDDTRRSVIDNRAGGHLARLGILLGIVETEPNGDPRLNPVTRNPLLTRRNIVTPADEANLTNYIIFRDLVTAVAQSWRNYRDNFFKRDLGTGLYTLSRLLAAVAESVGIVYGALESVMVSLDARETTPVRLGPPQRRPAGAEASGDLFQAQLVHGLSVEELLSWISAWASREAPLLIQEGGRRGIEAILPTVTLLEGEVRRLVLDIQTHSRQVAAGALPAGLTHTRVQNPLQDLLVQLGELRTSARTILTEGD